MSDKSLVVGEALYYARLLENNLGKPDFIGVGCATPRQVALSRSVPREQFFNLPICRFVDLLICQFADELIILVRLCHWRLPLAYPH